MSISEQRCAGANSKEQLSVVRGQLSALGYCLLAFGFWPSLSYLASSHQSIAHAQIRRERSYRPLTAGHSSSPAGLAGNG